MADLNEVRLIGRLTKDPELNFIPNGTAVVQFGIAVNRRYKGQDGLQKDEVTFIDCVAWGITAQNLAKYMKKGRLIFVGGRIIQESWDDKQTGQKRHKTRVVAENVQYLDKQSQNEQLPNQNEQQRQAQNQEVQDFGAPPF